MQTVVHLRRAGLFARATLLLAVMSACAAGLSAAGSTTASEGCQAARNEVRGRLNALAASVDSISSGYVTAVRGMLRECDNDARTMSAQFADDWRIQSYLIERDLNAAAKLDAGARARAVAAHRSRVERLLAIYDAMFSNPPVR